jgi:hypothetical protein
MTTYIITCLVIFVGIFWLWDRLFPRRCKKCKGKGVMEVDEITKNNVFRCLNCGFMSDLGKDESGGWE